MINLTPYTIATSIIISSVFIAVFILFCNDKRVVSSMTIKIVLFIVVSFFIRLFIPVEFKHFTIPVSSIKIVPSIINFLKQDVFFIHDTGFSLIDTLMLVWLSGTIIAMLKYIATYHQLIKNTRYVPNFCGTDALDTLNELKASYGFNFTTKLIVHESISAAAEFGFFKQTIMLPMRDYSKNELRFILLHELIHFSNYSNWIKAATAFFKCVFWWNPLSHLFESHLDLLNEIYVDLSVTSKLGTHMSKNYVFCILNELRFADTSNNLSSSLVNPFVNLSNEKIIKRRVEMLMMPKQEVRISKVYIVFCCVILLCNFFSYRFVIQPGYLPPIDDLLITDFSSENAYIIKNGDNYLLYVDNELYACLDADGISGYGDLHIYNENDDF